MDANETPRRKDANMLPATHDGHGTTSDDFLRLGQALAAKAESFDPGPTCADCGRPTIDHRRGECELVQIDSVGGVPIYRTKSA